MAGANVRRWGPVSPEPRPTCEGQVSTLGCSPLEASAGGGLDQPTRKSPARSNYHATVNAFCRCLKVIDTFRRLAFIICPKQLMRQAYKHRLKKHRLRGGFAHGPPPRRKMTQQSQLARLLP